MADISVQTRLAKALKYLQLARTSRELSYDSIPFVMAAEYLIRDALEKNKTKPSVERVPASEQDWLRS